MGKIFIWNSEENQTFTAEYGTQEATDKFNSGTYWKIPGTEFTMDEDTAGMTLTLKSKAQSTIAFPWVNGGDENPLPCSINLKNGTFSLVLFNQSLSSTLNMGNEGPLHLSLSNSAKLKASNFSYMFFGKQCTTVLRDNSAIEICPDESGSGDGVFVLNPIKLEDSSSLILKVQGMASIQNTIICQDNSVVNISAEYIGAAGLARFDMYDSASVTILNNDEDKPVFNFGTIEGSGTYNGNAYQDGLFNFIKRIGFFIYNPRVEFSAIQFSDEHLSLLIKNNIIKISGDNNKKTLKQHSLGGNRYSISTN